MRLNVKIFQGNNREEAVLLEIGRNLNRCLVFQNDIKKRKETVFPSSCKSCVSIQALVLVLSVWFSV